MKMTDNLDKIKIEQYFVVIENDDNLDPEKSERNPVVLFVRG